MDKFEIIDVSIFNDNHSLSDLDYFANFLDKKQNTIFLFWSPLEFMVNFFSLKFLNDDNVKSLDLITKQKNCVVYVLVGGFDEKFYSLVNQKLPENIKIIYWPTFLLNYTKKHLENSFDLLKINRNFENLFFSLNNQRRLHRAMFIDKVFENKLNDICRFSWNKTEQITGDEFTFKFWNEQIVKFDDFIGDYNYNLKLNLTDELINSKSLINVVGETFYSDYYFITEKTYKNFILEQPFLVISSKGFHEKIKSLGFVLYEEIFDYSFDNFENLSDRVDGVIKNLQNLRGKNYNELYKLIEDKLKYNKNKSIEISTNKQFVPKELIDLREKYIDIFKNYKFIDLIEDFFVY